MKILNDKNELEDILCNKCGKSCKSVDMLHDIFGTIHFECITGTEKWGYGSKLDGEIHEFHLCEICYIKLKKTFLHSPLIGNYLFPEDNL